MDRAQFGKTYQAVEASNCVVRGAGFGQSVSPMTSPAPKLRLVTPRPENEGESELKESLGELASITPNVGDPSIEVLYAQYSAYVAAVASRILGRASEVDDVVQDVFTVAVRALKRRDNPQQVKGWFAKVTVRLCTRQLRVRRLWAMVDLAAEPSYERLADPLAGADERQLVIEVYRALDKLPARERVPWTLRYVAGEGVAEVATLCGCSLATAKRRIARAHDKLNIHLKERAR
jgi:RNA polymerase sigma-70 factor (ECF subfamily)